MWKNELKQALADARCHSKEAEYALYNEVISLLRESVSFVDPAAFPAIVAASTLTANTYNPNKVAPPELKLLQRSLTVDGLTMPVVATEGAGGWIIVDGFHRTKLACTSRHAFASNSLLASGFLLVAKIESDEPSCMASTVRHNLARGVHEVSLSAELIRLLYEHTWTDARISTELGLDVSEVLRMRQISGLAAYYKDYEVSLAWDVAENVDVKT